MADVRETHQKTILQIDLLLARLQEQIEERRNIDAVEVDYGDVGDLNYVASILRQAVAYLAGQDD